MFQADCIVKAGGRDQRRLPRLFAVADKNFSKKEKPTRPSSFSPYAALYVMCRSDIFKCNLREYPAHAPDSGRAGVGGRLRK